MRDEYSVGEYEINIRNAKLKRVARCFNDIQYIRLAIRNIGTSVAEDIRIRLLFDADSFFHPEDMAEVNESALQVIFDDYTCDRIFGKRTKTAARGCLVRQFIFVDGII